MNVNIRIWDKRLRKKRFTKIIMIMPSKFVEVAINLLNIYWLLFLWQLSVWLSSKSYNYVEILMLHIPYGCWYKCYICRAEKILVKIKALFSHRNGQYGTLFGVHASKYIDDACWRKRECWLSSQLFDMEYTLHDNFW